MRDRDQHIFPGILDLGFRAAFFVAGIGIHEDRLESVMVLETQEPFRDLPASSANDLGHDRFRIVEPDLSRDAADIFKYRAHGFQQALHVFAVMKLKVSLVAVREIKHEILPRVSDTVLNKVGRPKVGL